MEVKLVENGAKLVETALDWRPDLIITDNQMPKIWGLEALRMIVRELPTTKGILITGDEIENAEFPIVQKGKTGFVRELKNLVGQALAG